MLLWAVRQRDGQESKPPRYSCRDRPSKGLDCSVVTRSCWEQLLGSPCFHPPADSSGCHISASLILFQESLVEQGEGCCCQDELAQVTNKFWWEKTPWPLSGCPCFSHMEALRSRRLLTLSCSLPCTSRVPQQVARREQIFLQCCLGRVSCWDLGL